MSDKLSFTEFERCVERGKAIDGEQLFNLVYALHEENEQLTKKIEDLKEERDFYKGHCESEGLLYD